MMQARLQRRVQRYGWDLAAAAYEPLWRAQLAPAHERVLAHASLGPGDRVVDVACGTGLLAIEAAARVGPAGAVVGVDLAAKMVDAARAQVRADGLDHVRFERMDAEALDLERGAYDAALCGLGLMYLPSPLQALREMRRVLRPGGRVAVAVWGTRANCAWSAVFPIVAAEVRTDVCPYFFALGSAGVLAALCAEAGLVEPHEERVNVSLEYADVADACAAAFVGGPVALAWSRFDAATRHRVQARYAAAIAPWRTQQGFRLPGEFVVVSARVPA